MNDVTTQIEDNNDDDTTNFSNDQRFNDAIKKARAYGRDAALGADALPKLFIELVRWSKDGVIELDPDKGGNKNAIRELYDAYWTQRVKKGVHTQTKEGRNAQVSKLKSGHTLGGNTWLDGEELLNRAIVLYKAQRDAEVKLKSVYAAYVDVARMVNDRDEASGVPTDEELIAVMLPKDKAEKTLADVIEDIKGHLEKIITGDRKDGIASQDQQIIDAHDKLNEWLAALTLQAEMDALRSKLNAMGMSIHVEPVVQPVTPTLFLAHTS